MEEPKQKISKSVILEPVSACPVKCILCPTGHRDKKKTVMTLSLVEKYLSKAVADFDSYDLLFGNWGEPLLHPQIDKLIEIAKNVGFTNITIATSFSTHCNIEKLAKSELSRLHISLSGMTPKTYNMVHRYGNLHLVKDNIKKLCVLRKEHDSPMKVFLRWHRYKHNEHEFKSARAMCKEYRVNISPYFGHLGGIDMLRDWVNGSIDKDTNDFINKFVFTDFIKSACTKHQNKNLCRQSNLLTIDVNGTLLHCCAFYDSQDFGIDFLNSSKEEIIAFKEKGNQYCQECITNGFCGYMHRPKR
jgi:MoaA/NifB/PqqE/SkfB family radical SAM enzyme